MYYYGVQFSLDQIGTDFGYNILLTGLIEAAAYFSFSNFWFMKIFLWPNCPERKDFSFSMSEVSYWERFSSLAISMTIKCSQRYCSDFAGMWIVIFYDKSAYSQGVVPLLQNESFPATLQSTGWGIIEGISQLGSFMTPFIVGAVTNAKINPVVMISCVMIVIGLFPIKFIKETLNKNAS